MLAVGVGAGQRWGWPRETALCGSTHQETAVFLLKPPQASDGVLRGFSSRALG